MSKPVLFSGMQPTGGGLTLGNYIGALKSWVSLQDSYDCHFCVVDLHGITARHDPKILRENSYTFVASYVAGGIDPEKNLLFFQSLVPQHAELAWILTCHTYMGELSRMTQFKDKSGKAKNVGVGLFTYPTLMAADILLYQTKMVPVGDDQKQHIELTRDLAERFNNTYGKVFEMPEMFAPPVGARIMSLMDPTSKMSKSDPDPNATVFVLESDDVIRKKFKRAVTDSVGVVNYTDEQPGVKNLISIQAAITGKTAEQIVKEYEGKQYGALKGDTAEIVIEEIRPIRETYERLIGDRAYLNQIIHSAADKARERASRTLDKVKDALGFVI